jgi:gliding motility-associated-like protein
MRYKVASGTIGTLINKSAAYVSTTRLDTGYAKVYQYGPPVATLKSKSNVKCKGGNDGSLEVQVTNGSPTYRYSIYGGSPYQYSPKFNNLPAASYVVTVTDTAGQTDTVQVTISEPTALSLAIGSKTNVTCNGFNDGTVTLSCTGGTPGYSYKAGTGTYQSSPSFTNVNAGTTVFSVLDLNGCIDTQYVVITEPSVLSINLTSSNVTCNGLSNGSIAATVGGGLTPYQYSSNGTTYQSSSLFSNLGVGSYTITTKDINGCLANKSVVITQPTALSVSASSTTNVDCKGNATGSVTVMGAGGTTPYTYNIGGGTYSSASTFGTLSAGTYTIGVKDANGCTSSVSVTITEPAVLNLSATVTGPVCYSDKTGVITLTATGGTSAYSFRKDTTWSTPTSTYSSTSTYSNLYEGNYTAQVKDANGCLDTVQILIKHLDLVKPIPVPHKILTVYLGATGTVFVSANMADSASTDNCAIASRSITKTSFNCSNVGYNTVNFKVVDINGNRDSIDFIVNVLDTTSPSLNTRDFTLYLDNSGSATLSIDSVDLGSTDQCGTLTRSLSKTIFNCQNTGYNNTLNKVVFTATDANGNKSVDTLIITVLDTTKPTLVLKNVTLYLDAFGKTTMTASDFDNGSYDNCNIDSLIMSDTTFDCSQTGINVITITGVDPSRNRTSSTINVTVYDTIKPTLQVKNHTVYLDTTGNATMTKMNVIALLYDNCGVDTLDVSKLNWTVSDTGVNEVYVWAEDASGNRIGPDTALVTVIAKDTDGDGIPDYVEGSKDTDGDGVFDYVDMDSDNDGLLDFIENENQDTALDLDGDGIPNFKDLDSDNDSIYDIYEVDGSDPDNDGVSGTSPVAVNSAGVPITANGGTGYNEIDTDGDGLPDYKDLDTDGDGIVDKTEGVADQDGDGIGNWRDTDSDGDGIDDNIEGTVDTDGDGIADFLDTDSDNDGISDKIEGATDTDGDGVGNWRDLDSDNDGISDQTEGNIDTDSDGTVDRLDLDSDNDGIPDSVEGSVDTDGDGRGNWRDLDSDDDGIQDSFEAGSNPATPVDTDGDGKPDYLDLDSDADGILDSTEDVVDTDGDGISDFRDGDSDGDGISDLIEGTIDTDGDGTGDWRDLDSDADGISDKVEGSIDSDGDGTGDWRDLDSDNDGISDKIEGTVDTDGDGKSDYLDLDSDGDGISDNIEGTVDTDGDGTGDWRDLDSDNDGINDQTEGTIDTDMDGVGDWRDLDSDNDGINDQTEGTVDTDMDGTGDWRDIDSDGDNILDSVEGTVDTDGDGKPDWRDLDSDNDGIADSTEGTNDFDGDGIGNWRDLDSDADGINDQTEGTGDKDGDLAGNWLDLDSDGDGISDKVEGTTDTDGDGVADYLDLDSDNDGISDNIEGTTDTDGDGTGDWRDLDSDNDGISDKMEGTTDSDGDGIGNWRDTDSDNDGINDQTEGTTDTDNDGQPDYLDLDSDNDGIDDKTEGSIDTDGDGKGNWRDTDSDDDELLDGDIQEGTGDSDGDGIPNYIDPDYFIPEGISPNGDNVNDVLYIRGLKAKVFSQATLLVFNRWGQVVYESAGVYKNDWAGTGTNGDLLPEGVYYVVFKYGSTTVDRNIYIKN